MNLWNQKDLPLPPISTFKVLNKNINIKNLRDVCTQLRDSFESNKYLYAEYLVLSRIVYRMKQKFRTSKDFKSLEKLYKALQRFFDINLATDVQTFLDLLPTGYTRETYFPTKNLLDFILVRLQGVVKLMERVVETCKITGYLFNERLHTGQFWKIAFILFSLVSRVYILAKFITQRVCEYYSKLLPYSNKLKNSGITWLPAGYNFPRNLEEWVNIDWLNSEKETTYSEKYIETLDCLKMLKDDSFSDYSKYKKQVDEEDSFEITEIIDIDSDEETDDNGIIFLNNPNNSAENLNKLWKATGIGNNRNNLDHDGIVSENVMDLTTDDNDYADADDDDDDIGEIIPENEKQNYEGINTNVSITNTIATGSGLKMKKKKEPKYLVSNEADVNVNKTVNFEERKEKLTLKKKKNQRKIMQSKILQDRVKHQLELKSKINKTKKKTLKNYKKDISSVFEENKKTITNSNFNTSNKKYKSVNMNEKIDKIRKQKIELKKSCSGSSQIINKSIKKKKRKNKKSNVNILS